MAALVALGLAALQPSEPAPSPTRAAPASPRQDGRRSAATVDLGPGELAGFSSEHNASLMWGTYRPGVYFGLRSRTYPTALVAGLMWGALDGVAAERKLRHTCEQDEVQRYGYTEHDGETYASQPIVDRENGLELQTSFVKPDGREAAGAWAARIEGKLLPGESQGAPQTVIFYLGIDGDAGGASELPVEHVQYWAACRARTSVREQVEAAVGVNNLSVQDVGRLELAHNSCVDALRRLLTKRMELVESMFGADLLKADWEQELSHLVDARLPLLVERREMVGAVEGQPTRASFYKRHPEERGR